MGRTCHGWRTVPARGKSKGKDLEMSWARGSALQYRRRQCVPNAVTGGH